MPVIVGFNHCATRVLFKEAINGESVRKVMLQLVVLLLKLLPQHLWLIFSGSRMFPQNGCSKRCGD